MFTLMLPLLWAPNALIRQSYCGPGWTYFEQTNACYKKIGKVSFNDGQAICQRMRANLAAIHSFEENEFIRVISNYTDSWLGGQLTEYFYPTLEILDRSVANYANWETGRPDAFSGCLKITKSGTWKVEECDQIRGAICKKTSFNKCKEGFEYLSEYGCQKVILQTKAKCDPGWMYFKKTGACYKVFEGEKYPNGFCITQKARLASIHSAEENNFIATMASAFRHTSSLIGVQREKEKWLTYDNSNVEFFNWASDEPSHGSKKETCVQTEFAGEYWHPYQIGKKCAEDCQSAQMNYVCKSNSTKACDYGWTYFDPTRSCYQILQNASFDEAESDCQSKNAHLASIHSIRENEFIADLVEKQSPTYPMTWIGGRFNETNRNRLLSGKPFNFTDGTGFVFSNWPLYNRKQRFDCIAMYTSTEIEKENPVGSWTDDSCDSNWKNSFTCKKMSIR